jgi:hypothetical protein
MRHLRQLCCTLTLLCVLATAALADGIMYPDHNPPPPPPPSTSGIMYPDGPLALVLSEIADDLLCAMTGRT